MEKIIFVVDDNNMNRVIVKDALKEHFKVTVIPSAEKLFMLMEKITPDIILLDIFMPEMDGFEAAQRLRNNSKYADIPVIFLTSTIDNTARERARELGVTEILTKPFLKPELIEKIKKHLNKSE